MADEKVVLDESSVLQEIVYGLREQIQTLTDQKASLEASLTSLRFQLDSERGNMMHEMESEKQKRLSDFRRADADLRSREKIVENEELRLSDLRKQLEDELIEASRVTDREREFNAERISIDRMQREAEELMLQAKEMNTAFENTSSSYAVKINDLDKREKELKDLEKALIEKANLLEAKGNETSERIAYYEKLLESVRNLDKKEE